MTDLDPTETTNLDGYGHEALAWDRARDQLRAVPLPIRYPFFLNTVAGGRPHSAGFGAEWYDGDIYLNSGPNSRKSRDLAANPACTVTVRLDGIDLVLEGEAHRTTDPDTLATVIAIFRDGGWPAEVAGDAVTAPFSAPSAGPPPWWLYRFTFHTAIGVASEEPYGATRWRFAR